MVRRPTPTTNSATAAASRSARRPRSEVERPKGSERPLRRSSRERRLLRLRSAPRLRLPRRLRMDLRRRKGDRPSGLRLPGVASAVVPAARHRPDNDASKVTTFCRGRATAPWAIPSRSIRCSRATRTAHRRRAPSNPLRSRLRSVLRLRKAAEWAWEALPRGEGACPCSKRTTQGGARPRFLKPCPASTTRAASHRISRLRIKDSARRLPSERRRRSVDSPVGLPRRAANSVEDFLRWARRVRRRHNNNRGTVDTPRRPRPQRPRLRST